MHQCLSSLITCCFHDIWEPLRKRRTVKMRTHYVTCQVICEQHNRVIQKRQRWCCAGLCVLLTFCMILNGIVIPHNHIISGLSCSLKDEKLFLPWWCHRLKPNRCQEKATNSISYEDLPLSCFLKMLPRNLWHGSKAYWGKLKRIMLR